MYKLRIAAAISLDRSLGQEEVVCSALRNESIQQAAGLPREQRGTRYSLSDFLPEKDSQERKNTCVSFPTRTYVRSLEPIKGHMMCGVWKSKRR